MLMIVVGENGKTNAGGLLNHLCHIKKEIP